MAFKFFYKSYSSVSTSSISKKRKEAWWRTHLVIRQIASQNAVVVRNVNDSICSLAEPRSRRSGGRHLHRMPVSAGALHTSIEPVLRIAKLHAKKTEVPFVVEYYELRTNS